ncbi:MAG: type II toxin-antitoxin system prevent-host-death family antitoxin [Betaproteobacteria bacterium]|nr:type II toxin-antitoxin system prevent-host-death family antitoxin [Betaproteobacteria bacterium]
MRQAAHVSIRELKSRLSHYLRLTKAGESVVITDRGIPIGRIVPIGRHLGERLAAMLQAGQAEWSGLKLAARAPVARIAKAATLRGRRTVAQLLVDDRG